MIETDRLLLREVREDDFDAIHDYASDPEVVQYVPWGPNTEQQTRDFIERTLEDARADPRIQFVFGVERRSDGRLIGSVGLYLPESGAHQAMLGYAYGRSAWGSGYASEAARAVVGMGFELLRLRRIWAACDPDNVASIRVLERLGMVLEGRLREDTVIRGEVRDSLVWGILEPEWREHERERQA